MTPPLPIGDIHDFDFFIGSWKVMHRRLKERLAGCDSWDAFPSTSRCEQRLGGLVNVDENIFPTKGFAGLTLRVFDPAQRRWSIYWVDSRVGVLTPPVIGGSGFALAERSDERIPDDRAAGSVAVATIHYLDDDAAAGFARFFAAAMMPTIVAAGGTILATLATESARNNFPRLPVREDEPVFVWLCSFSDLAAYERFTALLRSDDWHADASPEILRQFRRKPETLTLLPTRRSLLR
jgi:hypothetical protein